TYNCLTHRANAPPAGVNGDTGALGGTYGTPTGAPGGWNLLYTASEIAPMPHSSTSNLIQPPCGSSVTTRIIRTPTAMRPMRPQWSLAFPIIHWPITAPTTICAA